MLGEGIAISSIPLHLKSFGATAVQVGVLIMNKRRRQQHIRIWLI
jgi:hypothetical protein